MHLHSPFLVAVLLAACAHDPSPSPADEDGGAGAADSTTGAEVVSGLDASSSGTASDASSTGQPSLEPVVLERAWVASLAGPWLGPVRGTPLGDLPQFFWAFEWTKGGAMRAEADNGMGFRLVFELTEREGSWVLTETGTMPGGMTQSYELHPVDREGDRVRFELLERPGFLQVDIEPSLEALAMDVRLRGAPHGTFALARPR